MAIWRCEVIQFCFLVLVYTLNTSVSVYSLIGKFGEAVLIKDEITPPAKIFLSENHWAGS